MDSQPVASFVPQKVHVFVAAWGAKYVELATSILFPSLLQEGNLPSIRDKYAVSLHIYGEPADTEKFGAALGKSGLTTYFVDVHSMDQFVGQGHKYGKMTACHRHFLSQIKSGEYAVFMHPDFFISDHLFSTLDRDVFSTDCSCYFSHVLRISNTNISDLKELLSETRAVNSYQLTQFSLKNLLPLSKSYQINNEQSSSWPIELTAFDDATLFVYSYGMHPLAIRKAREVEFQCFDHDLPEQMFGAGNFANFRAQRDNRNFMIAELNAPNMRIGISVAKKQSSLYCAALYLHFLPGAIRNFFISKAIVYYPDATSIDKSPPEKLQKFVSSIHFAKKVLKTLRAPCERIVK